MAMMEVYVLFLLTITSLPEMVYLQPKFYTRYEVSADERSFLRGKDQMWLYAPFLNCHHLCSTNPTCLGFTWKGERCDQLESISAFVDGGAVAWYPSNTILTTGYMSSLNSPYFAKLCLDGDLNTMCYTVKEPFPFLVYVYSRMITLNRINITNRSSYASFVKVLKVSVTTSPPDNLRADQIFTGGKTFTSDNSTRVGQTSLSYTLEAGPVSGKYVIIQEVDPVVNHLFFMECAPQVV